MPLSYSQYVDTLANLMVIPPTEPNFVQILPSIIDYAEGRCYRDLDLLATAVIDNSITLTANSRNFTLPIPASGTYDVIDAINLVENDVRTPLTPVSRQVIDMLWPTQNAATLATRPQVFSMTSNSVVTVGPPSGQDVEIETIGQVRPTPLSSSNTTTYLTTMFPELFVLASMVFASGWQKNFGNAAEDASQGITWESQYNTMLADADLYSARQKFAAASWTSKRPEPFAAPQRG